MTQQHILACIDGSAVTESVCDYATWYASRLGLPIGLLNVVEVPASTRHSLAGTMGIGRVQGLSDKLTQIDVERSKIANDYSKALTEDAESYIKGKANVEVEVYRRRGKLLPAIELLKEQNRAIIMGQHGADYKNGRINVGSHIETIARATSVPILICAEPFKEPSSYMVAFDASKTAVKAVDSISKSPVLKDLQGHIVMIGHDDDSSIQSLELATKQLEKAGFKIESHHLPKSDAVEGLLDFRTKNQVDIIVIGAYGRSKLQQLFLGSTTTKIIAQTVTPVILVR